MNGNAVTSFVVCDSAPDAVFGISESRPFPSLVQAIAALTERLKDDYTELCADAFGVNEETGEPNMPPVVVPESRDYAAALGVVVGALGADVCPDLVFNKWRYWVTVRDEMEV